MIHLSLAFIRETRLASRVEEHPIRQAARSCPALAALPFQMAKLIIPQCAFIGKWSRGILHNSKFAQLFGDVTRVS